jgi:hypothetical protein
MPNTAEDIYRIPLVINMSFLHLFYTATRRSGFIELAVFVLSSALQGSFQENFKFILNLNIYD